MSPRGAGWPGDDPGPEQLPSDLPWGSRPQDWQVPDDLAELADEVAAFRLEQRRARRRARWQRVAGPLSRQGVTAPIVLAALLLVGLSGLLLVLLGPRGSQQRGPSPLPLAHPQAAPGTVGGLLPALALRSPDGTARPTESLERPAALVLVPPGCSCGAAVTHIVAAAATYQLHEYVVGASTSEANSYAERDPSLVEPLVDAAGALLAAYVPGARRQAPTLVVLARDGRVPALVPAVGPRTDLASALVSALAEVPSLRPATSAVSAR